MARPNLIHNITDDSAIGGQVIQGSSIIAVAPGSYMTRTATSGNRRTYTWAAWVKRQQDADKLTFMFAETDNDNQTSFGFNHDGATPASGFYFRSEASGTAVNATPNGSSRDFSSFYHVIFAVDTTQSNATDRIKFYLNGTLKGWSINPPMSQNYETHINQNGIQQQLFAQDAGADLEAIISQLYFVDGQQLGPENFGYTESQTGIWRPKKYTGTYGTNGFYLPFDGSSHISKDMSGNGNDFTPHNMRCTVPLSMATGGLPILNTNSGGTTACPGVRPDPLASNIVLALPLSDRSATAIGVDVHHLIKGSGSPKTLTNNGSIANNITQPHFYGRSGAVDLADMYTDRIEISASDDFNMGTGDFTVECWIHPRSTSAVDASLFVTHDGSTYFAFNFDPGGEFNIYLSASSVALTAEEGLIEYDKWNHVALVRYGNVVKVYVNGLSIGSINHTGSVGYSAASTTLCRIGGAGGSTAGALYMQDYRIYKGVAKYTDTFTCGSQNSSVVPDSPSGIAVSRKFKPSISGSVGFEGTNSKLVAPHHTDLNATNQDFCFEAFIYPVGSTSNFGFVFAKGVALQIAWNDTNAYSRMTCYLGSAGGGTYDIANDFNSGTGSVPMHQWSHFAFVRSSGTLKWYINGIEKASTSISGTIHANTDDFNIGAYSSTSYEFKGSISNVRITIGQAVYTSNFTTPTEPLTLTSQSVTSSNVKLLCCKDKFDESAVDKIPTGSLTVNNSAKATSFTPFLDDVDSRVGNYPALNPLEGNNRKSGALTEGNLFFAGKNYGLNKSTVVFGPGNITTGKYFWEIDYNGTEAYGMYSGITANFDQDAGEIATQTNKSWLGTTASKLYNTTSYANFSNLEAGTMSFALDVDNQILRGYYNTRLIYTDTTIPNASTTQYAPFTHSTNDGSSGTQWMDAHYNFGQRPFTFTPPEGYESLGSANIPPVPIITKPEKQFGTLLYSGDNATSRSITGLEFAPDLIIQKRRSDVSSLVVWDSVRGVNKTLYTEDTYAETDQHSTGYITEFGLNGFTFALSGGSEAQLNASGHTYLAWCWKGGGAAVTNNVGSISSQVSVNTKAGFSIVTYTGTGSSTTVGHGLGVKPGWIIIKCRSNVDNWMVYHNQANGGSSPEDQYFELNAQGGDIDSTAMLNDTAPTSTVVTIGSDNSVNGSGRTYVMYCWNEIPGYSKFGGFTGNGSTDGIYVNLGFRPAWLMLKRADSSSEWNIWDINRNVGEQPLAREIRASRTYAESGYDAARYVDFLSNGFKMRTSDGDHNANGGRYIYMAFAEQNVANQYGAQSNAR